jgi:pimeloyl-ACP methyl ester carboxylesterase
MSSSMILSSKVAWWKEEWRLGRDFFMQVPLALAAALQLDRPVFIGSSIGGMLAVDLARYHPQEFRAVIGLEVRRRMHNMASKRAACTHT